MTQIFLVFLISFGTTLTEQKQSLEQQLKTSDKPGEIHLKLSEVLRKLGESKAAVTHAEKALEHLPESAPAHCNFSVALRHKMEKSPMSWMRGKGKYLSHLEKAIELDETYAPAYHELSGFHLSAPGFLGAHTSKALEIGKQLAKHDIKSGGRIMLNAYQKQENEAGQIEILEKILKQYPDDADIHYDLGFLLQTQKKYQECLKHFERFIEGDEPHKPSLYQAARTRILGGFQLEQAVTLLDRYIEVVVSGETPTGADARWRQGVAYQDMGNQEKADQYFRKALALNPNHEQATAALSNRD